MHEIIVDSFAGGGGASAGIELAVGRAPDIAINHDAIALAMHLANHPTTRHLSNDIWKVDPREACAGRPVGLLWASPDCKHFSKAKGGKTVEKKIRDLAWVVVRWARLVQPRVIMLENVEEFATWGPLGANGRPCPDRKGFTFRRWVGKLKSLGYQVEHRELRACDYGAPTIRKRLFLIARRDGLPIVWPAPTHGDPKSEAVKSGRLLPWRAAAEIIDWSLPCPSIFLTPAEVAQLWQDHRIRVIRPLKPNTMARIAKGIDRYVINAAEPFIVPITHARDDRVNGIKEPLRTQTTAHRGEHALVTPFVTKFNGKSTGHDAREPLHTITSAHSDDHPGGASPLGLVTPFMVPRYGERAGQEPRTRSIEEPMPVVVPAGNEASLIAPVLVQNNHGEKPAAGADEPARTITTQGNRISLCAAFLAKHYGDAGQRPGSPMPEPVSTITAQDHNAVVSAGLMTLKGSDRRASAIEAPVPTITAQGKHIAEVRAFLIKYHRDGGQLATPAAPLPTIDTTDRIGIVTVQGIEYQIVDIGMRMLTARERFNAQGFPPGYIIELDVPRVEKRTGKTNMKRITGDQQGRMVGNSVSPVMAEALVTANFAPRDVAPRGADEFRREAAE